MPSLEDVRLDTHRLRLRPLREADAPDLFEIFSDPMVTRYLSHPPWPASQRAFERIADNERAMAEGRYLRLGMERKEDGKLVGECSMFNFAGESRRAEIGYVLGRHAWGHGYMGEALTALVACAFGQLDLNRLEAEIDPRNAASATTLERLGFRREGLLRERWIVGGEVSDSGLYGLLRSEWQRVRGSEPPAST